MARIVVVRAGMMRASLLLLLLMLLMLSLATTSAARRALENKEDEMKGSDGESWRPLLQNRGRQLLVRSADSAFQLVKKKDGKKEKRRPAQAHFNGRHRREEEAKTRTTPNDTSLEHLEEKERAYVNAMEQFRIRGMGREQLRKVGKEYEEEVEKFGKEGSGGSGGGGGDSSSNSDDSYGLTVFFGVGGGESNCEFTLDKGRWMADRLNVKTLVIPTCDHLFHTDMDVDLLDYMIPDTISHCKKEENSNTFEVASWNHNVNAEGLSTAERFFGTYDHNNNGENVEESGENGSNPSHHQQLVPMIEQASKKKILCVQIGKGGCKYEGSRFTPNLEFDSVITQNQLSKSEIESKGYEYIYVAGVFDWRPQDDKVKQWPGLFKMCDPPQYQEKIFNEARKLIKKYNADHPIDPEKTLCAHWRQEDFFGGNKNIPYVDDPIQAAKIMSEKAKEHGSLTDVLVITNDPSNDEDEQRLETLKSELTNNGLTPHTMHHDKKKHTHDVFVDKAACLLMKGFIGTQKSSFSESIASMHGLRDKYV